MLRRTNTDVQPLTRLTRVANCKFLQQKEKAEGSGNKRSCPPSKELVKWKDENSMDSITDFPGY